MFFHTHNVKRQPERKKITEVQTLETSELVRQLFSNMFSTVYRVCHLVKKFFCCAMNYTLLNKKFHKDRADLTVVYMS